MVKKKVKKPKQQRTKRHKRKHVSPGLGSRLRLVIVALCVFTIVRTIASTQLHVHGAGEGACLPRHTFRLMLLVCRIKQLGLYKCTHHT